MEERRERKGKTYCVTGGTGYIGSWLVKSLLERGYTVHATLRSPEKASHLFKSWQGGDRLRLFRADLLEDGSFDEAVIGCDGVFHVAASMEFGVQAVEDLGNSPYLSLSVRVVGHLNPIIIILLGDQLENLTFIDFFSLKESYVKTEVINPAIRGTLNVLKACLRSNTARRIVFTSSISTLTAKNSSGGWIPIVDEACQTHVHHVLKTKASGWVYALAKLLTEEAAFQYAEENGIDLISVITTTVGGPFLTPTVPSSIQVLLSPITGDPKMLSIMDSVNSRMGSIALVHIEDICNAHMFLMEHPKAEGRYICCIQSCVMSELVGLLRKEYPCSTAQRSSSMERDSIPAEISSKKIRDMGFEFKYGIQDIIHQTIRKCVDCGFLPPTRNK